jgi:hypothetical protein
LIEKKAIRNRMYSVKLFSFISFGNVFFKAIVIEGVGVGARISTLKP